MTSVDLVNRANQICQPSNASLKKMNSTPALLTPNNRNKSYVSPILRRVFSRPTLYPQFMAQTSRDPERHPDSRTSASDVKSDLGIDILTEENVQFMDQPLRGKIELSGLPAPIDGVSVTLRGVVKTCVAGNGTWASGFGGDSNMTTRLTEREVTPLQQTALNVDLEARVYTTSLYTTCKSIISRQTSQLAICISVPRNCTFATKYDVPAGIGMCGVHSQCHSSRKKEVWKCEEMDQYTRPQSRIESESDRCTTRNNGSHGCQRRKDKAQDYGMPPSPMKWF